MADVIPITRAAKPRPGTSRYQVVLGDDGLVQLRVNGAVIDCFTASQSRELGAAFGAAALLSRADEDVLAGRVLVARGRRRQMVRLVEHRGTVVRLELDEPLLAAWFALTDGAQVDRSAASRRWVIEEPHRKALRQRYDGGGTAR